MAHEIMEHDSLFLNKTPAWHGLGLVLDQNLSPKQALTVAGLDWEVRWAKENRAIIDLDDGSAADVRVTKSRSLFRVEPGKKPIELGAFGARYEPVQNAQLAELAYAFGDNLVVESAGSIQNGAKVWFLIQGESISLSMDEVKTYMLIANSHDGTLSVTAKGVGIRVVCNNTLSASLNETGRTWKLPHSNNIKDRIEVVKSSMAKFHQQTDSMAKMIQTLANKQPKSEREISDFFAKVYEDLYGIPNEKDDVEKKLLRSRIHQWDNTLKSEMMQLGVDTPDYWLMANAVTSFIQKDEPLRKTAGWRERATFSKLIGPKDADSTTVFNKALWVAA